MSMDKSGSNNWKEVLRVFKGEMENDFIPRTTISCSISGTA